MPLPPKIDAKIRSRFDELIEQAQKTIEDMERDNREGHARQRNSNFIFMGEIQYQETAFSALVTSAISLVQTVLGKTQRTDQITENLRKYLSGVEATKIILGILVGLKSDYESGLLDSLPEMIETNVASDYMGQAEQLLSEGIAGQYDHVPAAVLTGAVLEGALRTLCGRQHPPISTLKKNGDPKTLNPLIEDLQKANVYNKAKADQLRYWAKIRNYAAHGEFSEFKRDEVEAMITGIKTFLADYM